MNILIYTDRFLEKTMTFINNQIEFVNKDNNVTIACIENINTDLFDIKNVNTLKYSKYGLNNIMNKISYKFNVINTFSSKALANQIGEIIEAKKIDIMHVHFGPCLLRILDCIEKVKIPTIVTLHGYDASSLLNNEAYKIKLKHALELENVFAISVSKYMKDKLIDIGIKEDKIFVHYIGTNTEFFEDVDKMPIEHDKKIKLLQVARFVEKKGHSYLIEALRKYIYKYDDNIELILAGEGELKNKIEKMVVKFGIEKNVRFLGAVNKYEVKNLIDECDIFVQPSITDSKGDQEGIPTAIMEAMAMRKPILSTRHSGIPELVRNHDDGLLSEEGDIIGLCNNLRDLIINYDKFANNSRELIINEFDVNKNCEGLEKIYFEVMKRSRVRR